MFFLQGDLADSDLILSNRRRQAADIVILLQADLADSDLILSNRRREAADIVYSSGRSG